MTLATGDLTTVARVQVWLPDTTSSQATAILGQLVTSMSQLIKSQIKRPYLASRNYSRTFDGTGTPRLVLPDWPVSAISAVQVETVTIPPAPQPAQNEVWPVEPNGLGYGYRFPAWDGGLPGDPAAVELIGAKFWRGKQNVSVSYTAGYLVSAEPQTVPIGGGQVTANQPFGLWSADGGVTYASGTNLRPVSGSPSAGQYVPPGQGDPATYTFSSGDSTASVLISYSFVPADLEEACIQMVAERYGYRGRVGQRSKSLGGNETMAFDRSPLPPEVARIIAPYMRVVPISAGL